jgi:hypothetical protein
MDLLGKVDPYRAWVAHPFISDHAPILLQLDGLFQRKFYPFKLNPGWLHEVEFSRLVTEVWKDPKFLQETGLQRRLVWKLKCLKMVVKRWVSFKNQTAQKLDSIEEELQSLYQASLADLKSGELIVRIKQKEAERLQILTAEEDSWR